MKRVSKLVIYGLVIVGMAIAIITTNITNIFPGINLSQTTGFYNAQQRTIGNTAFGGSSAITNATSNYSMA